jgi:hypothetical protein
LVNVVGVKTASTVVLDGPLTGIAMLHETPVADQSTQVCAASIPEKLTVRLLGLTYSDGSMWLLTTGECGFGTVNGRAVYADLFQQLGKAGSHHHW